MKHASKGIVAYGQHQRSHSVAVKMARSKATAQQKKSIVSAQVKKATQEKPQSVNAQLKKATPEKPQSSTTQKPSAATKKTVKAQTTKASPITSVEVPTQNPQSKMPTGLAQAVSQENAEAIATSLHKDKILSIRKAISLLFMLTPVPVDSSSATVSSVPSSPPERYSHAPLPFATEKALVEVFTFLSSTTNDPAKVAAFCLESCVQNGRQIFWLKVAANHGDLNPIKQGLDGIISAVREVPHTKRPGELQTPSPDRQTELMAQRLDPVIRNIVILNCNRILCRLISCHARWKCNFKKHKMARTSPLTQMFKIYDDKWSNHKTKPNFGPEVELLRRLFSTLETSPSIEVVSRSASTITTITNIVKTIYHLWRNPDFRAQFEDLWLSLPLAKLARYRSAALFLVNDTEARHVLDSMTVQIVKLLPISLPKLSKTNGCIIESASHLSVPQESLHRFPQKLKNTESGTPSLQEERFVDLVNTKCSVHAEIQLLFHYELKGQNNAPQVILSTKKPCFLCASFFALHGRFYIPKSHGRLYEKWTLPSALEELRGDNLATMKEVLSRFLNLLSTSISHAALKPAAGKLASTESFFRRSSMWAWTSRAPSLEHVGGNLVKNARMLSDRLEIRAAGLAHLRASTSMLVSKCADFLHLGRGRTIVFQLDADSMQPTTIRTKDMCLIFSHEDDAKAPKAESQIDWAMLVKVHRPDNNRVLPLSFPKGLQQVVDVSHFKPGDEVVIEKKNTSLEGFQISYNEDCLFVQLRENLTSSRRVPAPLNRKIGG